MMMMMQVILKEETRKEQTNSIRYSEKKSILWAFSKQRTRRDDFHLFS